MIFGDLDRVQHRFQNSTCRAGQASPKPYPTYTSTCPTTLLNKGEWHCEDSAQNITCPAG